MDKSGIYKILNIIDNKIYIGSAINFRTRFNDHKKLLRKNKHHSKYLQNAWNLYKEENFQFQIIEECSKELLIEREQYYLDIFRPFADEKIGYNICHNAGNSLGRVCSKETKEKIRKARRKQIVSEETKITMSLAQKGKHKGPENPMYKIGENHPNAKLNWDKVKELRRLYETGNYTKKELASLFEIKPPQTYQILLNHVWIENSKNDN